MAAGHTVGVDEKGDLKKGTGTVGVQHQYTGTAGRIENAQVAVYLVYASRAGHAVVDREVYLLRAWADDSERPQAAGVPQQVGFATKPELATVMVCRALDVGVPAAWVTDDEISCGRYQRPPLPRAEASHRLRWSVWRRHQARARSCHYRRQAARHW